jgi:hypothetical protein
MAGKLFLGSAGAGAGHPHVARHQGLHDNDAPSLTPEAMLTDLLANNREVIKVPARYSRRLRSAQRCSHRELDRELDRRNRKPDVVPLRNPSPRLGHLVGNHGLRT